jgi:hypothetical protein
MRYLAATALVLAGMVIGTALILALFTPMFLFGEWGLVVPLGVLVVGTIWIVAEDLS